MKIKTHDVKKNIVRIISVLAVAGILELLVFNFTEVSILMNRSIEKNIRYTLADMDKVNWKKNNDSIISDLDPMLILWGINKDVRTVKICVEASQPIESNTIFFTNSEVKYFSELGMVIAKGGQGVFAVTVDKLVKDLRIDLVEDEGLVLHNITVIINPVEIQISFSRIITVISIYFGMVGLFRLQKSPNYQIDPQNGNSPGSD